MPTKEELAYLAGLWDGEGTITIFKNRSNNGYEKLCPTLGIVNTDLEIINAVLSILDKLKVSFHIFEKEGKKKDKHKLCYQLTSRNSRYIEVVLQAMLPYLRGKKSQAELVLRFVKKRIVLKDKVKSNRQMQYDPSDYQTELQLRRLNRRGPEPSETKGLTPSGDDIVRPHDESVS